MTDPARVKAEGHHSIGADAQMEITQVAVEAGGLQSDGFAEAVRNALAEGSTSRPKQAAAAGTLLSTLASVSVTRKCQVMIPAVRPLRADPILALLPDPPEAFEPLPPDEQASRGRLWLFTGCTGFPEDTNGGRT